MNPKTPLPNVAQSHQSPKAFKNAHEFLPPEALDLTTVTSRWRLDVTRHMLTKLLAPEGTSPMSALRIVPVELPTEVTLRTGYMVNTQISYVRQQLDFESSPICIPEDLVDDYSVMRFRVGSMNDTGDNPDIWGDLNHWNTLYPEIFFLIERFETSYFIRGTYVLPARSNERFTVAQTGEAFSDLDINRTGLDVMNITKPVFNKATMEGYGIPFILRQWSNLWQWSDPALVPDRFAHHQPQQERG